MAEDIKNLIEKIQQEGIQAAQEKALQIEEEARLQAQNIIAQAKKEAQKLISEAKEKCARLEESSNASLKQAGRDLLLNLREQINALLDKIILSHARAQLTPQEITRIIALLIKDYGNKEKGGIVISLGKEEFQKLEKTLLSELKDEVKKGVTLKSSDEIGAGFIISFDAGKSHFDFTDKALAQYLGGYLKPAIAELLKEGVSSKNNP